MVREGSFIVTGSSTNICDLVPQLFVSHESREPLNFTRVFTSQTKAINKSETYNIPKGGTGKESSAGRKARAKLWQQMVLYKRSTLGSFCCSLFINTLSDIGITARVQRYADNKPLFYSSRSPAGTEKSLQRDSNVLHGTLEDTRASKRTDSLQSEDETEKFHGSPAWPPTYRGFFTTVSHFSPRSRQPRSHLLQPTLATTAHRLRLPEKRSVLSFLRASDQQSPCCSLQSSDGQQGEGGSKHSNAAKQKKPSPVLQLQSCSCNTINTPKQLPICQRQPH